MICIHCNKPKEEHGIGHLSGTRWCLGIGISDTKTFTPKPEQPICEFCGSTCYRGAEHNARVEDKARWTDDTQPIASRECVKCARVWDESVDGRECPYCEVDRSMQWCEICESKHDLEKDCPPIKYVQPTQLPKRPTIESVGTAAMAALSERDAKIAELEKELRVMSIALELVCLRFCTAQYQYLEAARKEQNAK